MTIGEYCSTFGNLQLLYLERFQHIYNAGGVQNLANQVGFILEAPKFGPSAATAPPVRFSLVLMVLRNLGCRSLNQRAPQGPGLGT